MEEDRNIFTMFVVFILGVIIIILFAVWYANGSAQAPCSDFANTPMRDVPARCIGSFR